MSFWSTGDPEEDRRHNEALAKRNAEYDALYWQRKDALRRGAMREVADIDEELRRSGFRR